MGVESVGAESHFLCGCQSKRLAGGFFHDGAPKLEFEAVGCLDAESLVLMASENISPEMRVPKASSRFTANDP